MLLIGYGGVEVINAPVLAMLYTLAVGGGRRYAPELPSQAAVGGGRRYAPELPSQTARRAGGVEIIGATVSATEPCYILVH